MAPGAAHHLTQRGTNRQIVFSRRRDRRVSLDQLPRNASAAGLRILAYCLMNNHLHLILVPLSAIIRKRSFLSVVRQRRHHPRRRRASSVRSSAKLPHPVM
jgi:REP element-mobilizing transposase RayT